MRSKPRADRSYDFCNIRQSLAGRSLQKPFKPAALLAAVAGCLEAAKRLSSSPATGNIAPNP
jgi:hypothetical protein